MADNGDFLKLIIRDTTFHWPRLDQPYRYNSQEKRTEPCAAGVTGAGYSIAWDMTLAEAGEFKKTLMAHYEARRAVNRKLPEFSQIFGAKKDDEAKTVRFVAKKRAVSNAGDVNKPPRVMQPVDGEYVDLAEKSIWSGSKGMLRINAFPTTDPDGKGGISLLLDTVIVTEAVYGSANLEEDFGPAVRNAGHAVEDQSAAVQQQVAQQSAANAPAPAGLEDW